MSEKILGIIEAVDYSRMIKKGSRLALTTDRLIVARGSAVELFDLGDIGFMAAGISGRKRKKEREKVFAELTPEGILSAGKENLAIPWSEVTKVEVSKESWAGVGGVEGKRFKVFTADKKYQFGQVKGRMLGEFWHILNLTIPDKVTVPKDREKFEREVSKLENTPVDVLCTHLCSLGFEAEIWGLEEEDKKFLAYLDQVRLEIKDRNIAYVVDYRQKQYQMQFQGIGCILQNVEGIWQPATTKWGKQDFEWVGDKRICDALNQDSSIKNALLEEMQAKEIKRVEIIEPKDNSAQIVIWPKEYLPTKRLLEAVDRIAGYLHKIK